MSQLSTKQHGISQGQLPKKTTKLSRTTLKSSLWFATCSRSGCVWFWFGNWADTCKTQAPIQWRGRFLCSSGALASLSAFLSMRSSWFSFPGYQAGTRSSTWRCSLWSWWPCLSFSNSGRPVWSCGSKTGTPSCSKLSPPPIGWLSWREWWTKLVSTKSSPIVLF